MELESKLEDALGEPASSDQLPVCSGQDVRPRQNRGAVRRIERITRVNRDGRRLIYAGHIDDVEEVGEFADDLDARRLTDRDETRITQVDLLDVSTRRGIAADEKRSVIGRHAVPIQVVVTTHIEAEAGVEARDDADLVIIRQRAHNPVTDIELRIEDAAEDEGVALVGER